MADKTFTKSTCIELLQNKSAQLAKSGDARYPRRSDFGESEVAAIKSFLGPWPRALEAAGVKSLRDDSRAKKTKEKRIAAKREKTRRKIANMQNSGSELKQSPPFASDDD